MNNLPPLRVLVMGRPNAGKTTFSKVLAQALGTTVIDADEVRREANDWDFSIEGRERQATRMREKADAVGGVVVANFVCPTERTRAIFQPHYLIFLYSPDSSPYADTDALFEAPQFYDWCVRSYYDYERIRDRADDVLRGLPQGYMIGRFQPWHIGHQQIAEEAIRRHGLVTIHVRAAQRSESNPHNFASVRRRIDAAMASRGVPRRAYRVEHAANVAGVYYGRDVGYTVERVHLKPEIEAVRASDIRASKKVVDSP